MNRAKADGNLRRIFREAFPSWHWQPIESLMTGNGTPDANCCFAGREFWIEYKATSGYAIKVRPEQVGWHLRRARSGGVTFFAVRRSRPEGPRVPAVDELWLFAGADAAKLATNGLNGANPLGWWEASPAHLGPRGWDWDGVSRVLLGSSGRRFRG